MLITFVDYISNIQCTEWKLYCKGVYHQLDSHKVHVINWWSSLVTKLPYMGLIPTEVHVWLPVYQHQQWNFPWIIIILTHLQFSNATIHFLVTVVTNLHINNIQEVLTQQLQKVSLARLGLPITVSSMERYGRYTPGTCNLYNVVNSQNFAWFCRWMWSNWGWSP